MYIYTYIYICVCVYVSIYTCIYIPKAARQCALLVVEIRPRREPHEGHFGSWGEDERSGQEALHRAIARRGVHVGACLGSGKGREEKHFNTIAHHPVAKPPAAASHESVAHSD